MRWFEESLTIKDMPESDEALLVGVLEEGIVKINVEIFRDSGRETYVLTEWSKPIKMWQSMEPTTEEVREKYWDKLTKIKGRHEKYAHADWVKYLILRARGE
jgi:hypothetical protein